MSKQTSPKENKLVLVGAHVSIAGGIHNAIERGTEANCNAIQIFTKSNRQWKAKPLTNDDIQQYKTARNQSPIKVIIAHASYLINIGSPKQETAQRSYEALKVELERCNQLELAALVLHPGSHTQSDTQQALKRIGSYLNKLFEQVNGKCLILLENMAGQGSSIGRTFEELASIIDVVSDKKQIGICFDTCHAFAGGYKFDTKESYQAMWSHFNKTIGLNYLKAMHINDSKKLFDSRVDRHEHIGQGEMKLKAFDLIMNDERFKDVPKILETPKDHIPGDDIKNIAILKGLID